MKMGALLWRETLYRAGSSVLALAAAAVVAGSLVGARARLAAHDAETDRMLEEFRGRAAERMEKLRDDARVFSKSLGFNILLLPEGQDAAKFYAENRSERFFTADQVAALAGRDWATLNHLLPVLRQTVRWEEFGGDVVVMGIEGEIFIKAPGIQAPIEEKIAPGEVHVGDAIRERLGLAPGRKVEIQGHAFTVRRLLPQKGNIDDVSVLMNLADAQALAGLEGKVGGVLALSCNCAAGELDPIRAEVGRAVAGVQVIEFSVQARARQHARDAVDAGTRAEMADIKASRVALRGQMARMAGTVVGVAGLCSLALLGVLGVANARERRGEVAMLRALGAGSGLVLRLFLAKALLLGAAGGAAGCVAGMVWARVWAGGGWMGAGFAAAVLGASALVSVVAAVWPAMAAARTDPAEILNRE